MQISSASSAHRHRAITKTVAETSAIRAFDLVIKIHAQTRDATAHRRMTTVLQIDDRGM